MGLVETAELELDIESTDVNRSTAVMAIVVACTLNSSALGSQSSLAPWISFQHTAGTASELPVTASRGVKSKAAEAIALIDDWPKESDDYDATTWPAVADALSDSHTSDRNLF